VGGIPPPPTPFSVLPVPVRQDRPGQATPPPSLPPELPDSPSAWLLPPPLVHLWWYPPRMPGTPAWFRQRRQSHSASTPVLRSCPVVVTYAHLCPGTDELCARIPAYLPGLWWCYAHEDNSAYKKSARFLSCALCAESIFHREDGDGKWRAALTSRVLQPKGVKVGQQVRASQGAPDLCVSGDRVVVNVPCARRWWGMWVRERKVRLAGEQNAIGVQLARISRRRRGGGFEKPSLGAQRA
jgi:hypothetical protein